MLTRLLGSEEGAGQFHGIKMDRNAPAISHLLYADDLLVMTKADKSEP